MKKWTGMIVTLASVVTVYGANYNYNGNGADPNDWFDAGNWGGGGGATNWPTTVDNALFTTLNTHMIISQAVPEHAQLQVGRNTANTVTIVDGGAVTSLNQTVSGIVNGLGALVIDGGYLRTKALRISVAAGGSPDPDSVVKIKSGAVKVDLTIGGPNAGDVDLGLDAAGTIELSGGTLTVDNNLDFTEGTLKVVGSDGSMTVGNEFKFGTAGSKSTEARFVLGADGSVSTIFADSITFTGTQTITIDGTFAETDAEQTLVLIELTGSDTFSPVELDALNAKLNLVNVSSGSLSLAGGDKQLVFTGTPVSRELIKAWEFNTVGDTEGWDNTTANTAIVGVGVSNDIDSVETVLTSADVTAGDGQLFFNESQAPGSFITRDGKSWRTMEIRLRQLDANPDEPGVASMQFDPQGTTSVLQFPVVILNKMENLNPLSDVLLDDDEWVIVTYDISGLGANDLRSLRIDPIGNPVNTNFNFEVDYVRLYAGASQPPIARKLAQAWEFNTPSDAEGWYGIDMTGVTAAEDIDGVEGVLTCADIVSIDPQAKYTNTVSFGNGISWDTLEFRARQLTDNPGNVGVTSTNWLTGGTLALIQSKNLGGFTFNNPDISVTTNALDDWVDVVVDISSVAAADMDNFRIDFVGGNADLNVEVDYIRVYKQERLSGYEYWASQYNLGIGTDGVDDDPDFDDADNLYEYAFGGDPTNGAVSGQLPIGYGAESGGSNVLEYVYYRNASPYNGLTYSLEGKNDLVFGTWTNDVVDYVEVGSGAYSGQLDAVTNHVTIDTNVKFIRTLVE